MPTVYESADALNQGNTGTAGLHVLSLGQQITFTKYMRHVLPLDGFVFWLRTASAVFAGSLHVTMTKRQNEDETSTYNRVVFSTDRNIQEFNDMASDTMWVGEYADLLFAFTVSTSAYEAANLFHYSGDAVYPALRSQLINNGAQLTDLQKVVSNSLPAWLGLRTYSPVWLLPNNPGVTLYPSYAVPNNLQPPYGVAHIEPNATEGLQAIPGLWAHSITASQPVVVRGADHYQLASDRVRITLYGLTNERALAFLDMVVDYSVNVNPFGIMSMTPIRDEKRTQPELGILAMKKTVEFVVSYTQSAIDDVVRQLMFQAAVTVIPNPLF